MEIFLSFIFYNHYQLEEEHLSEHLFLEMKNYSFSFENSKFDMDIVPKSDDAQLYELYFDEQSLYILTPFLEDETSYLAIFYPIEQYHQRLTTIKEHLLIQFLFFSLFAGIISLVFAIYTLSPMRASILLLEEFIKDIIHDLNTPVTAILINLKMMKKSEEVESIAQSANTIAMLHKNLDVYLRERQFETERFSLQATVEEQVKLFAPLYDHLKWQIEIEERTLQSNQNGLSRILYNLISNACKYNTSNGFVTIIAKGETLTISNDSHGIKHPAKVFNRFYKEGERGLGIGLHIVEKLAHELHIEKRLWVEGQTVFVELRIK